MSRPANHDTVREQVRKRYAGIAKSNGSCCATSSCCNPDPLGNASASAALGYSPDEMNAVPEGSNLGLGCGNPGAIAALRPGETVLDLGSGGGFDCFLAADQVGKGGRVIGVDMTPEMVSKARANAAKGEYRNVDFRLGEIEHLPVADASVDVVISNCVINLSPDKAQVFAEAFRVLRPGGRLAISDVVAVKPLPKPVKASLDALCGCVAGAALVADVEKMLREAGFVDIAIRLKKESRAFIKTWFPGSGAEKYVISANIEAGKGTASGSSKESLDARTTELIAVAASVAAHCQPCLTYHVASARGMGIGEDRVRDAMAIGHRVEKGAVEAMRSFSKQVFDGGPAAAPQPPACCSGTTKKRGKSCCG
jgi:AhpD family alkylhydroperoxidase